MYQVNLSMPDVTGMSEYEASALLKENYLSCRVIGNGGKIVSQIPAAGKDVPGYSTVLLYTDDSMPAEPVSVPDLSGMALTDATKALSDLGLYLQAKGADPKAWQVTVTHQEPAAGTELERGEIVTVLFADTNDMD